MYDYAKPSFISTESSIVRPTIAANNFELKPNSIQMIQQFVQFDGLEDDDPNTHLPNVLESCDTFKINGVSDDAIRLRLFPFSLRNKAKQWLNSLPRGSITTWEQMTEKFLLKYFLPAKTAKLRNNISSFVQMDLETLYDAWERYKDLLRRCPHHGLPLWLQVQTFYNGVNPSTRQLIDAATGGTLNNKTPEAAYEFIEEMSLNNYQWQVMRTKPTKGVFNLNTVTMLSNQVELLNEKIDGVHPVLQYDMNEGGMSNTEHPPYNPSAENEQIHYMGNNSRAQNNPLEEPPQFLMGWSRKLKKKPPPGFQQQPYPQEKKPNLEEMLIKFIAVLETRFQNTETTLKNQQASTQGIENQLGSLPSNTEPNPREQLHAITAYDEEGLAKSESEPRQEPVVSKGKIEVSHDKPNPVITHYKPRVPSSNAIKKDHTDEQFAFSQMPNSVKFFRELLSNKRKLDDALHVELNTVYSAILQNRLPYKLKDLGSFTIPCLIGSLDVTHALADLGASIDVMSYKMFKQLGLGKPKQTRKNKIIRFPKRIVEDVLVKIDKFIFLVDFVILDMDEDSNAPLILGRPFLATAKTKIDVGTGELTLCVGDDTITLQARNLARTLKNKEECFHFNHSVQPPFQEAPQKYTNEPHLSPGSNNNNHHEEQRVQIDELDEWRTHVKEKSRKHDVPTQFTSRDQVYPPQALHTGMAVAVWIPRGGTPAWRRPCGLRKKDFSNPRAMIKHHGRVR
ncbi:Transposon Ty3-I Gag-Pol polyprotein [Gossypium australe]|uniref:Transposon Ty3-I Gag-Pol polyprotein n=1 Tax=Gossypium australe TaxID=47621 RepID=A0A5B6WR45_9ROSI|nr:Transposon Ty3-I Gag-Pol polyprotein [Gossypium australe]